MFDIRTICQLREAASPVLYSLDRLKFKVGNLPTIVDRYFTSSFIFIHICGVSIAFLMLTSPQTTPLNASSLLEDKFDRYF